MIMITTSVKIVVGEGMLSSITPKVLELPLKTIVMNNVLHLKEISILKSEQTTYF